ncbi:hypothetical protein HBA54_11645 [Pelagibius litoralis]|uniref:Uncharacterized protein n=1 Tax=Pelagibius litoralis TaxID=374515 RepID=A0A967EXJ2_9PROT|nr:hypothetical protein [Pelagibius litoralis]NIA69244.1 hypothetical protein [Pelagibius litoralis]
MAKVPAVASGDDVAAYKAVLQAVLDKRPSGTRQRLATALGKNRSFISQISNPSYAVPIPARHLDIIFEICHLSVDERQAFLEAYGRAHPRRLKLIKDAAPTRELRIQLPDLGDEVRNRELERVVEEFVQKVARLFEQNKDR